MPGRVLCVDNGRVRVAESDNHCSRYVALSHCWGPFAKRPIRTTKSTLSSFKADIPWSTLPKSYQDAITVVRLLGISHVWIDSLCIVQDDKNDWLRESALMGSIYERAEFTIAASHAADSSEGFLHKRPDQVPAVELPHFLSGSDGLGKTSARVFARLRADSVEDTFPENGALNQRAWATQEWLLSRRVIFFTPAAIMWSCKMITQRETGERCFNISRNIRWKTVVEAYSERKLTYATDRLVALEGLRIELQKTIKHQYLYGIWEHSLPDQLLWQVAHRPENSDVANPLALPSWTWAQTGSGVRFLQIDKAKNMCHTISISDNRINLTVRSRIKALSKTATCLACDADGDIVNHIRADIASSHARSTPLLARIIMDGEAPLGWVVYDAKKYEQQGDQHLLALMSTLGRRDDEADRLHGTLASSRKIRQHWCLVVQKTDSGGFCRIGVGKTYSRAWWLEAGLEDVTIS